MNGGLYLLFAVLTVIPFWHLCPRYRLSSWLALISILPFGAIALLWTFVYRDRLTIPGIDT